MKHLPVLLLCTAAASTTTSSQAKEFSPSFPCVKVEQGSTEAMICSEQVPCDLDTQLGFAE